VRVAQAQRCLQLQTHYNVGTDPPTTPSPSTSMTFHGAASPATGAGGRRRHGDPPPPPTGRARGPHPRLPRMQVSTAASTAPHHSGSSRGRTSSICSRLCTHVSSRELVLEARRSPFV
jgi:hypothetical protein